MMSCYGKANIRQAAGFTLIELVVVVCILGIIATIAIQHLTGVADRAKITVAQNDMAAIRDALCGSQTAPGYLDDLGAVPGFSPANIRVANLLMATNLYGVCGENVAGEARVADAASPDEFRIWSAERNRGWRGPYLRVACGRFPGEKAVRSNDDISYGERGFFPPLVNANLALPEDYVRGEKGCSVYGFPGEPSVDDPWGNPYVIQVPPPQAFTNVATVTAEERFRYARVVSAGPDGVLSTPCFFINRTNDVKCTAWSLDEMRLVRLAGLTIGGTSSARGDDLVLFIRRPDIYEE